MKLNRLTNNQTITLIISIGVLVGVVLSICLNSKLGLDILWNLIVPLVPLLMFFMPNLWVDICPFSNMQGWSRRLTKRTRITISSNWTIGLKCGGLILFFLLVPLRIHYFNSLGGLVTLTIIILLIVAFLAGQIFEGLSGWCEGICPVRYVERVYSLRSRPKRWPQYCVPCSNCVRNCGKRKTRGGLVSQKEWHGKWSLFYVFPGFLLAYFSLSLDNTLIFVYGKILLYSMLSFIVFKIAAKVLNHRVVASFLPMISLIIYYFNIIPKLIRIWFF